MQKIVSLLLFLVSMHMYANTYSFTFYQKEKDSISYAKNSDRVKQRSFSDELTSKYNGKDFIYTEEKTPEKKPQKKANLNFEKSAASIVKFMASVFPYLLAIIVIFILIKSFVYGDKDFWKFSKTTKKGTKKLIFENEDENINEHDYDKLLAQAIQNKEYRLATRYYYLSLLKKMSKKGLIDYHKDKTNSQYLFELKDNDTRKQFSYLLYIYDYVWYGEFVVDTPKFNSIENSYKNFINTL